MESDQSIAAVQPKILSYYQRTHFEYAGAAGGFIDKFGYPFCRGRIFDQVEEDYGQYDTMIDVFWATGACMFIRSELYHQVGGFDSDFWAHMEEIDLCWRLKNRGYRIVYTPDSRVYHVGGGTLDYSNPRKLYLNFRNNLWLLYKNLPAHQLFYILFTRMVLDFVAATKLLGESNFNGIKSVMKAHWHFYQSLPTLNRKRKLVGRNQEFSRPTGMLAKSIVFQFYIRKKRQFNEIKF